MFHTDQSEQLFKAFGIRVFYKAEAISYFFLIFGIIMYRTEDPVIDFIYKLISIIGTDQAVFILKITVQFLDRQIFFPVDPQIINPLYQLLFICYLIPEDMSTDLKHFIVFKAKQRNIPHEGRKIRYIFGCRNLFVSDAR